MGDESEESVEMVYLGIKEDYMDLIREEGFDRVFRGGLGFNGFEYIMHSDLLTTPEEVDEQIFSIEDRDLKSVFNEL